MGRGQHVLYCRQDADVPSVVCFEGLTERVDMLGAYRTAFSGLKELRDLPLHNITESNANLVDIEPYSPDDFYADLQRVTGGKADRALARIVCDESFETTKWLASIGIEFQLSFDRQAYQIDGRHKFWGGMVLSTVGGGKGLVKQYRAAAQRAGVEVSYGTSLAGLILGERGEVTGAKVLTDGKEWRFECIGGVILACGGFEASPEMRATVCHKF